MSRFQPYPWACGPTALYNAAAVLGLRPSLEKLIERCETTARAGTSELGILKGADSMGLATDIGEFQCVSTAWYWLVGHLYAGHPTILCVEEWDHWVTAESVVGGKPIRVLVSDPANTLENMQECGRKSLTQMQLIVDWAAKEPGDEKPIWGVAVF